MKKIFIFLSVLFCMNTSFAQSTDEQEEVSDLNGISETPRGVSRINIYDSHYTKVWKRQTFFNINYENTTLSSGNVPLGGGGVTDADYKNKLGVGITWGHTYKFHKKPIGNVLFFGLDYVWTDANFNKYEATPAPNSFYEGSSMPYTLPWHLKKSTFDYGMSLGPSITLYPFTPLQKRALDHIRLQAYFRVGYDVGLTLFPKDELSITGSAIDEVKNSLWHHGLYTEWGANFSWNFFGIGYAVRNDRAAKYNFISSDMYESGGAKFSQISKRVYIQFRF